MGVNDLDVLLSFSEYKTIPAANRQVSIIISVLFHLTAHHCILYLSYVIQ